MSSTNTTTAATNHLIKHIVKSGTVIPMSEALTSSGLTDENGNTITFTEPLPVYYLENNGFAYSLEGLEKALVTLRIEKLPAAVEEQQQQKQQPTAAATTTTTTKSKAK